MSTGRGTTDALGVRPSPSDERDMLAAAVVGPLDPPTWRTPQPRVADVFTAKALVGAVLDALHLDWDAAEATKPFLHPGRAGAVLLGGEEVGWFGELHPLIAREWDLDQVAVFELALDPILAAVEDAPQYRDVTSFPPVRQDLAVLVDPGVAAADVVRVVRGRGRAAGARRVFDATAASRWGGTRVRSRRPQFRRRRPHAHRRGGQRAPRGDRRGARVRAGAELRG
jgi:phenylalanyl-tRNA synthetase beta chain